LSGASRDLYFEYSFGVDANLLDYWEDLIWYSRTLRRRSMVFLLWDFAMNNENGMKKE